MEPSDPAPGQPDMEARAIERRIVLSYVPAATRPALAALLTLDDRLGEIVRAARDPLIGQMRLTWWHEALVALDAAPAPAEPILRAIAAGLLPHGVAGAALGRIVDGWEAVLAIDSDPAAALAVHAAERGEMLFALAARLLGGGDARLADAGAGWALATLCDPRAQASAAARLAGLTDRRWPRALRPLSAMALLARDDLDSAARPGSIGRAARLFRHWLGGR
ncbi:hypothetical protein NED98_10080 [Sphingomonas sp. MMSM20]|uniref:squalene/phytoene synthase family protein n=1 Tax=Sphingomonas lycopersici TaxID=2951807 RepID=UPI00223860FE|nr:squalene/phytoene synthase family protein [Sphingomonas lycopersici]MCW6530594.1 hypothetical protein [Sphingomonas lycopersici]